MGWEASGGGMITFHRDDTKKVIEALEQHCGLPLRSTAIVPGEEVAAILEAMQEVMHIVSTLVYDFLVGSHPFDQNIITLELSHSGKWNDDIDWIRAIAPYIIPTEVCIEMTGEDDSRWGYAFNHGEVIELTPQVIWPTVMEEPQVAI